MVQGQASSTSFWHYVKNNGPFLFFIIAYVIVNLGLFISRAIQYKDSHIIYILARAAGKGSLCYKLYIFKMHISNTAHYTHI